jgi:leucyl-tRNA synthetase
MSFRPIPAQIDLPAMEHSILDFWRANGVFEESVTGRQGAPTWTFYEGPPTANGMPGTHHIEARVFKDVFPRFHTMKGKQVVRKAGWDCHGLPVEIAVEKELGFSGKGDIEKFGIAQFNDKCRESVTRQIAWASGSILMRRIGLWHLPMSKACGGVFLRFTKKVCLFKTIVLRHIAHVAVLGYQITNWRKAMKLLLIHLSMFASQLHQVLFRKLVQRYSYGLQLHGL